jgi:hypothetical protein
MCLLWTGVFYVATQLHADGAWDGMKSRQRNRLSGWRHCDDAQSYSVGFLEVMVEHGRLVVEAGLVTCCHHLTPSMSWRRVWGDPCREERCKPLIQAVQESTLETAAGQWMDIRGHFIGVV